MQRLELTGSTTRCRIYPISLAGERSAGLNESSTRVPGVVVIYTLRPRTGPGSGWTPRMRILRLGVPVGRGWTAA